MHHPYLRFLTALIEAHRRRMAGMRGPYSPSTNVLLFVSLFPALNTYALFTHVIFPDARKCAACTTDIRGVYGFIAWVGYYFLNVLLLMTELPVQPLSREASKLWCKYFKVYAVASVVLAFM